jgi:hypothetical protein
LALYQIAALTHDSEFRHGEQHHSLRRLSHSGFLQRKLSIEHHFASRNSLL